MLSIEDLKTKSVAILGFGAKEGLATAKYLRANGVTPTILDRRLAEEFPDNQRKFIENAGVPTVLGETYMDDLATYEVIFRNPAVPFLSLPIQKAKAAGSHITSQTKWFFERCPGKIIGVTGTKGKGTTSSLIYRVLEEAFSSDVYLTGNIGYDQPFELLDKLSEKDWVIFELSSFQLQDLESSPHIAVVLMITSEHLDHHIDTGEYREAKLPIVKFQKAHDTAIVNIDYEGSKDFLNHGKGQKLSISKQTVEKGCVVLDDRVEFVGLEQELKIKRNDLILKGAHNLENIAAASLASFTAGADLATISAVIKKFPGLEHRLEFVGNFSGVDFYNDSFATTPEATIAAIASFDNPLVLIAGGSEKNSDFTELGQALSNKKNLKGLILVGPSGVRIKESLAPETREGAVIKEGAQSIEEIFKQIASIAETGDTVLLSSAAASFGIFKDYVDRGNQFKRAAKEF